MSIFFTTNITSIFKEGETECENNYRPVTILSNVSKVFERFFLDKYQSRSCHTVQSAIWLTFSEFLIFCKFIS